MDCLPRLLNRLRRIWDLGSRILREMGDSDFAVFGL